MGTKTRLTRRRQLLACGLSLLLGAPAIAQDQGAQSAAERKAMFTPVQLAERAVYRRAIEAVNWGIPVVNYDRMYQAMVGIGGSFNQIVYWSGRLDWKSQTLTPNSDVIVFIPFFSTKDVGPMVLEIPAATDEGSITGTITDVWQAPLEDVGPAGLDRGKGGKYLILPPGYDQPPPDGYLVLPSATFEGYALLRSIVRGTSKDDVAAAVAYGMRIKLYPLSQAAEPQPGRFLDAAGVVYDSSIPYDMRFFTSLNRVVQYEPWLPRDKAMVDILKSIDIEKGEPFQPDAKTQRTLLAAIREAHAWLNARYESWFPPYFAGEQWAIPAKPELLKTTATFYETPDSYAVDARGLMYHWGFSNVKHPGRGQFYLMSLKDKDGRFLEGSKNYRLSVPPNAPAKQYWSATVYDRATHAFIRNSPVTSRSSQTTGLQTNKDGSVDIYFGPKMPAGKASNWVPTYASDRFEVVFRLYGPEQALFDKTWVLPDIESMH